jgi:hypothetical protein
LLFPDTFLKPVVAQFDQDLGSSDGGAVLLKAADRRLGVTRTVAESLRDERDPERVVHDLEDLVAQRVFTLACGYPDANDAARLADDPVHKLLLDREYERWYCPRGDTENRIKELFYGLDIGRTSCSRFWANQFRVLLTQAAYVLLQELRLKLRGTALARAQVATLRDHLLKLGVRVVVSVRRIVLHLPRSYPFRAARCRAALGLGAGAG